jgi:hypothetical protein
MSRFSFCVASSAALIALFAYGCSDDKPAAAPTDAGTETGTAKPKDAGYVPPDAPTPDEGCKPGDVKDYAPVWKAPSAFNQGKCSDEQVEALVHCNFGDNPDQTTCDKISKDAAYKACQSCLFTASTAKKLGPVYITGSIGYLNIAGCVANAEGNPTETSCGAKYQAANGCAAEACEANCPGSDAKSVDALNACEQKALTSVCQTYSTAADCATALLDTGGVAEVCNFGTTFEEAAFALGKLFCSSPTGDAGPDGEADAADDGSGDAATDAPADAPKDAPADG